MPQTHNLRPAVEEDLPAIKRLVYTARLNPTQLRWQRFIVATDSEGAVTGCAQIKSHQDGSRELASLVVHPDYRGAGIARALIENLTGNDEGDLYLMCRAGLRGFYEKFGFKPVREPDMPPYFRRIARLVSLAEILRKEGETLLVMKR